MLRPSIFTSPFEDNMFEGFFDDPFFDHAGARNNTANMMKTDIRENDKSFQIDMDLPGYDKKDVQGELQDGYLTIRAKHEDEKDEKDEKGKYIRRERYCGSYQRSFYVGDDITQDDIKARFKDGVLMVEIPKKEKKPEMSTRKMIAIEG